MNWFTPCPSKKKRANVVFMRLQEFYGVPLEGDVGREAYQLVCADSQGELLLNHLNE